MINSKYISSINLALEKILPSDVILYIIDIVCNRAVRRIQTIWRRKNIIGQIVRLTWYFKHDMKPHIIVKFAKIHSIVSNKYIGYLYEFTDEGMKNVSKGNLTVFKPHAKLGLYF